MAQSSFTKAESHLVSFSHRWKERKTDSSEKDLQGGCLAASLKGAQAGGDGLGALWGLSVQPQDKKIEQLEVCGQMCAWWAQHEGRRGRRCKYVKENDIVVKRT